MQSSKIDFITKNNNLIKFALSSSQEFPNILCEFLVSEYEIEGNIDNRVSFQIDVNI